MSKVYQLWSRDGTSMSAYPKMLDAVTDRDLAVKHLNQNHPQAWDSYSVKVDGEWYSNVGELK